MLFPTAFFLLQRWFSLRFNFSDKRKNLVVKISAVVAVVNIKMWVKYRWISLGIYPHFNISVFLFPNFLPKNFQSVGAFFL